MSVTIMISIPDPVYRALAATADRHRTQVHTLIERALSRSVRCAPLKAREPRDETDHRIRELNEGGMSDKAISKIVRLGQPAVSHRRRQMGLESPTPNRGSA